MLKKYLVPIVLGLLIIIINAYRFVNLDNIPNGMQIDEQTSGVTLTCLAQEGTAPLGYTHYPLFGYNSFATPTPPTYMYPGMLWVKAFGFTIGSLRAFTAFAFTIALLGLFAIGRHWGGIRCGLWILLAGSISPWTWTFARVAWESIFMIPFLVWGLFFCFIASKHRHFIFAGILLSAAAYSYPPARLEVPLTLVMLVIYGMLALRWKWSHVITLGAAFFITSLPLGIIYLTDKSLSARFNELSITNINYLSSLGMTGSVTDLISIIAKNFISFLTPDFLFFKGTPLNLTLTTGRQGIMSWLDVTAVVLLLPALVLSIKDRKAPSTPMLWLFGFLAINLLIGIFPATLISIDNPHPLRALGAWPFAILATGLIIHKSIERCIWISIPATIVGIGFTYVFLTQYFTQYPKDSIGMFNIWTVTEAQNAKTDNDWMTFLYHYHPHMFTSRYFLMRYRGQSCKEARETWTNLYPMFKRVYEQQKTAPH
ncbi:MAG: hypothetical protein HQL17_08695 [Candidatus Omnitrophica bacterium]|nr:hypothetical protein [Candidatus Omnitrophota bacterium]